MEVIREDYNTAAGVVEGVIVKWVGFSIIMVTGAKGFLACPAIDAIKCGEYDAAAAIVESSADNPIGTLERFADRKITQANDKAKELGIKEGMLAGDAYVLIA
jgi:uncharacterized protein YunC (DUF1805 family)